MSNVSSWSTTAANNNSASPNGFPENMAPSGVNNSARENMAAAAKQYKDTNGTLVTAGTGTAYTLTTNNVHAALADQGLLVFRINTVNTGSATLNVDSLGAKTMNIGGAALIAGALPQDSLVTAAYNATGDVYDVFAYSPVLSVSGGQVGTGTRTAKMEVIGGSGLTDDEGLSVTGTYSGNTAHPLRVESDHPLTAGNAVAGIDSKLTTSGTANIDHIAGYQARCIHGSTGTLDDLYGYHAANVNNGGALTNNYSFYVKDIQGTGTVTNSYGLYIGLVDGGATSNYAIYSPSASISSHVGNFGIGVTTPTLKLEVAENVGDYVASFSNNDASGSGINIIAGSTTDGILLNMSDVNSLETGKLIYGHSNSNDTSTRELVTLHNDNSSATGTTVLEVIQDAPRESISVKHNATSGTPFKVDANVTGANVMQLLAPTASPMTYLGNEHATTPNGAYVDFTNASPDNRTQYFLTNEDSTAVKSVLWSDGGADFTGDVTFATKTPSSASDTGIAGTITWDADYIYVCTATNTWKRVAIATW